MTSHSMEWDVEVTAEFEEWWGPSTARRGSRWRRIQHRGRPYRVLYAFDPRRVAILLIGGEKTDA